MCFGTVQRTVHLSLFCVTVSEGWRVGVTPQSRSISQQTCSTFSQCTKRRSTAAPISRVFFESGFFLSPACVDTEALPLAVLFSHEQLDFKLQHLSCSHFPKSCREAGRRPLGSEGNNGKVLLENIVSSLCPFPPDRADRYGLCFVATLILICATAPLKTPVILYLVLCLLCSTGCHH